MAASTGRGSCGDVLRSALSPQPDTTMVGLIGRGIDLSRTPRMHEGEAAAQGLRYVYRLLNTDHMTAPSFADVLGAVESAGYAGVNVTHPYKREAMSLVDKVSPQAEAVGAINTIVFGDGKRFGHNTDCWGFEEAFRREMSGADKSCVLQFGAGGAGGAVATALLGHGVGRLLIVDIDRNGADTLAGKLEKVFGSGRATVVDVDEGIAEAATGIVNATPLGMVSHPGSPIASRLLSARHWVADIVYFPLETELLRRARALGCKTMPGSGMAVFQAARAFELFTGRKADPDRMKACFDAFSEPGSNGGTR